MRTTTFAAAVAASLALPTGASALTVIDPTSWGACIGTASCTIGDATLTAGRSDNPAADPWLAQQDFRGQLGLGVQSRNVPWTGTGGNNPEIQGNATLTESITVSYGLPQFIRSVTLHHFYNPSEFSGDPQEQANIRGTFVDGQQATLTITNLDNTFGGFTLSDSTLVGSILRTSTFTGTFVLSDLFPGKQVVELLFTAGPNATDRDQSDYTLGFLSSVVVPLPAGAWLALTGLAAFFGLQRHLRRDERTAAPTPA